MGVGNFFGMLPEKLNQSKLYGVELDSISGRIAKLLYPDANIQIKGFEKTDYPNDFFDVAIGNVPFGAYKVNDRQYDRFNFMIHDYFLPNDRSVTSRWCGCSDHNKGNYGQGITRSSKISGREAESVGSNPTAQHSFLRQMQEQKSVLIFCFSRSVTA